jgi:hypothetical protein
MPSRWCYSGSARRPKLTIGTYAVFFLLVDHVLDARRAPEERRALLRHLLGKLPYVAAALPFALINLRFQPVAALGVSNGLDYALVRGQAAWRYLWLLLGLLPGQPIYDPPPISHSLPLAAMTLLPLVAPPVAFVFALRRGHTDAALALAWLTIGLIAPLVFPLTTYMADRYLYSPSLGFCWLLAAGIAGLAFAPGRSPAWTTAIAALVTAPLLLWYAGHTWGYTPVWRTANRSGRAPSPRRATTAPRPRSPRN